MVYSRQVCSQKVLGELLGINDNTIGAAIAETRALLTEIGHHISAAPLRFTTVAELTTFLASGTDLPQRSTIAELLADPNLTGLTRAELAALTTGVGHIQDARNERHRHRRRGGERLPGARGGVFIQKITNTERVLAAVLYQRKLCTQDVLAELFAVSRRTIGDIVREVGPIVIEQGYHLEPAGHRFANAQQVLDNISHRTDPTRTS